MVYAATGINALYFAESVGNPIMAVQPIYMTDGRIMIARADQRSRFTASSGDQLRRRRPPRSAFIYTNDDVGQLDQGRRRSRSRRSSAIPSRHWSTPAVTADTVLRPPSRL
ncbi:MAG: hypothetical protein MZU97_24270 [Bacillus subtilis]|nr:hypothetical protein [Bacillus subtilis]